ncbi:MAG: metallophosphoesterase [Myxococcales bacterium]|nr:metallophosphoesterase [Myxococcales bacterium]
MRWLLSFSVSLQRTQGLAACVFVFLLVLGVPVAHAQSIRRGPYLQQGAPDSVVVVWRTSQATTAQVRYGLSPQTLGSVVTSNLSQTQHEIKLTGLKPNTLYYYAVGTADTILVGGDAQHTFRTSPPHGQVTKMRLWVVGDSGTGGTAQREVRDAMTRYVGGRLPDLFLHMGDMAYNTGTDSEFQTNFFDAYRDILRTVPCWPTMGNHEGQSSDSGSQSGPYYDAYVLPKAAEVGGVPSGTEAYYSFDYGHVHFIVLDSHDSSRAVNGPMLTWLRADLAATKQPWLIAYWHHPPYTKGSHDSDTESQLREMRERALPILEAGGVDLILGGHSHIYERSFLLYGAYNTPTTAAGKIVDAGDGKVDGMGPYLKLQSSDKGTVYVVAGHGGASPSQGPKPHPVMYFTEKQNGSCLLDITGNALTLTNIRRDGVLSDRFTLVKREGLLWVSPFGDETWAPLQMLKLRWRTVGRAIAQVHLRYSLDGGLSWKDIARSLPNTGTYDWMLPNQESNRVLLRIEDASNPAVFDETKGYCKMSSEIQVIKRRGTWRYHASGQDLGRAWLDVGYDHSGWLEGKAQLGYGDGDEATVIQAPSPTPPSYYFRKTFSLSAPLKSALLRVLHDDGVIVWVNGQKVFSKYADNGDDYASWASSSSQDNEESSATLDATALQAFRVGQNVIAVMIKQRSATSSDISFDLSLEGILSLPPPQEPVPEPVVSEPSVEPRLESSAEPPPEPRRETAGDGGSVEPAAEPTVSTEPSLEHGTTVEKDTPQDGGVLVLDGAQSGRGCAGCETNDPSEEIGGLLCLLGLLLCLRRRVAP